jgi:hypothetical protein
MPKYRALAMLFIDSRLILAGEDFDSDLAPGKNWHPMDAEAKAKCEQRGNVPDPKIPGEHKTPLVEIPDDWRDLTAFQQIALARKLGAPGKGLKRADAINRIETEVVHRATVPA